MQTLAGCEACPNTDTRNAASGFVCTTHFQMSGYRAIRHFPPATAMSSPSGFPISVPLFIGIDNAANEIMANDITSVEPDDPHRLVAFENIQGFRQA